PAVLGAGVTASAWVSIVLLRHHWRRRPALRRGAAGIGAGQDPPAGDVAGGGGSGNKKTPRGCGRSAHRAGVPDALADNKPELRHARQYATTSSSRTGCPRCGRASVARRARVRPSWHARGRPCGKSVDTERGAEHAGAMTNSQVWDEEAARRYDETTADLFSPEVLGPTVDLLAELADGGRALEFAIGTGRVGLALAERGVPVTGIELSEPMAAQLRAKAGAESLPVVIGDMATARVPGEFSLVYLVFNTISNLLTQDEQVECFRNAARHLSPGGRF